MKKLAKNKSSDRAMIVYKGKKYIEATADFRGLPESFLVGTKLDGPLNAFRDAVAALYKEVYGPIGQEYRETHKHEYARLVEWFQEVWELDNEAAKML